MTQKTEIDHFRLSQSLLRCPRCVSAVWTHLSEHAKIELHYGHGIGVVRFPRRLQQWQEYLSA